MVECKVRTNSEISMHEVHSWEARIVEVNPPTVARSLPFMQLHRSSVSLRSQSLHIELGGIVANAIIIMIILVLILFISPSCKYHRRNPTSLPSLLPPESLSAPRCRREIRPAR